MRETDLSRRRFIKTTVIAGVTVYLAPLYSQAFTALFEENLLTVPEWSPAKKRIRYRKDAQAKVMGSKVFARDIRAQDMPHWPEKQGHVLILRTTLADREFTTINLSMLEPGLQPDRIVTAQDLINDGVKFPAFYGDDMLLPSGKTPAYLGQAVAMLIYHDFVRFRLAKNRLQFNQDVIRYGKVTGPLSHAPWGAFRYVRVGNNDDPFAEDSYSSLKDTPLFPIGMKKNNPIWPEGKQAGTLSEQGMLYAQEIAQEQANPGNELLVVNRKYQTQSVDLAALEPDNSNGWYDAATQSLHLVIACQSPIEFIEGVTEMLKQSKFPLKHLFVHPCYTVGYGSKDHANFSYYGVVAALYGGGNPIRMAFDRYEHFQESLKRHAFDIDYTVAVDKSTGKFKSLRADMVANGGGRCNFTPSIVMVAITAAQSVYYFPKSDLTGTGIASHAMDAGSARGYGTLQSMSTMEMLIDEVAEQLNIDPIELRLRNVFKSGMKNTQGAIPGGAVRADEILLKAQQHPIWTERENRKTAFETANPGKRYGVGFGSVQKDFGNGAESAFARIEFTPEGRIALYHCGSEMGTGMSTSQAVICAEWLGKPAEDVQTSVTDWSLLPMISSGDSFTLSQTEQDKLQKNPLWTPNYCSASSSSNSSYYFSQATREAARILFEQAIWPAALSIWQSGIGGGQAAPLVVRREDARWVEGGLTATGLEVLRFSVLAKKAYDMNLLTGVVVHTFNRWQWAEADFTLNKHKVRLSLDGLAVRQGSHDYQVIPRHDVFYPETQRNNAGVTYYSAMATLVEIAIELNSGKIELLNHHSILECGNMIVPELVSGQIQGGVAMGIGYALHEYLPLYEDGPGNGTWNFNRYRLPRATDVAVWQQTSEVLAPLSDTDPPKGMAEVVMIPVVGALTNAVYHAIGHRFRTLPITAEKIREALA